MESSICPLCIQEIGGGRVEAPRPKRHIGAIVEMSDWVSPIVPVLKSDRKGARVCGDFKVKGYILLNNIHEKYFLRA